MSIEQAKAILAGYFGARAPADKLAWPFPGSPDHEAPITVADVLEGYKTAAEYHQDKRLAASFESAAAPLTYNHHLNYMAAKLAATPDEKIDEVLAA